MKSIKILVPVTFILFVMIFILMPSCRHDLIYDNPKLIDTTHHIPPPVDTTHCDTCAAGVISFTYDVLPILVSNCAKSGCHDSLRHAEGINTTNYTQIMSTTDISGNLLNSNFWQSITGSGGDLMPPGGALTAAQMAIIQQWLQQGAPNTTCSHTCGCDSTNVSYAQFIFPTIQNYCLGCHSSGSAYDLSSYSSVLVQINNGKLMKTIRHQTGPGIVAMPYGGQQLNNCTISKFQSWVTAGAPNN
jgi:hypothetical protein